MKGFIPSLTFSEGTLKSCVILSPHNSPFHLGSYERCIFLLRKKRGGKQTKKLLETHLCFLFQLNKPKTHIGFPIGKASD